MGAQHIALSEPVNKPERVSNEGPERVSDVCAVGVPYETPDGRPDGLTHTAALRVPVLESKCFAVSIADLCALAEPVGQSKYIALVKPDAGVLFV